MSLALLSSLRWKERSLKSMRRVRRRKRRRRVEDLLATEITLDLIVEILTRLPPKSLMRFKCVSTLWFSLIRSRYLTNRHLTVAPPIRPPRVYMSLVDHIDCDSMEVCHKAYESVLLSLSLSSSGKSLDQDLILPGIGGRSIVVIRGLILYVVCGKACIFNPTTRQSLTLPAFESDLFAQKGFRNYYFFGYDPVLDQYKVVCTVAIASKKFKRIVSEHWVFVLEVGGSWKKIEFDQPHRPTKPGLFINGVIYYLASNCMSRNILVCFDVMSEEFNTIKGPDDVVHAYGESIHIIEYDGKPAVFDYTRLEEVGLVNLWVLEDGGKWSRISRVLQSRQMHLVDNNDYYLVAAGTTQNGEVIMTPLELVSPYYVLYYDLEKNHLRKVRIRGIPKHWFGKPGTDLLIFLKHMDQTENIMHLEI